MFVLKKDISLETVPIKIKLHATNVDKMGTYPKIVEKIDPPLDPVDLVDLQVEVLLVQDPLNLDLDPDLVLEETLNLALDPVHLTDRDFNIYNNNKFDIITSIN